MLFRSIRFGQVQRLLGTVQEVIELTIPIGQAREAAADVQGEVGVAVHPRQVGHGQAQGLRLSQGLPGVAVDQQQGEFTLGPGAVHRMRYRILLVDGPVRPDAIEREWVEWSKVP